MLGENLQQLMLVFGAYMITTASPGPSTMAIMGTAMAQGRKNAMALALGVVTGSMIWAVLAATGISTILNAYAHAIFAIKIAGGLYLLYLAWRAARSALSATPRQQGAAVCTNRRQLYWRGVLMHLVNPKAVLGWIAIMSLGLGPVAQPQMLWAILGGCFVLGLCVNLGYALVFSTVALGRAYQKARRWIETTLAAVFGYAGLRLLLSRN